MSPRSVEFAPASVSTDVADALEFEKSAGAEHALPSTEHRLLFVETTVLSSVGNYFGRLHMESVQNQKHKPDCNEQMAAIRAEGMCAY